MPEVTIASHKWRKRTRDWSAVCDNTLKLDRSYGLVGNPSTLNEFGVCAPDCEICVTPVPLIGNFNLKCTLRTGPIREVMILPSLPQILTLPSQFELTIVGGAMTSAVSSSPPPNGSNNPTFSVCSDFAPGQSLKNILERTKTKTLILRGSEATGYASDWVDFGTATTGLNFKFTEKLYSTSPTNLLFRNKSVTRNMEIRATFSVQSGSGANWACVWGPISIQSRVKSFTVSDTGWTTQMGGVATFQDFFNPKSEFTSLWEPFLSWVPVPQGVNMRNRLDGKQSFCTEVVTRKNSWAPFVFQEGYMGCGAHFLMENRTLNVTGTGSLFDTAYSTTNDLGVPAPYSIFQRWGGVDKSYKWCYWSKMTKRDGT